MAPPNQLVQWLRRNYPRPQIDPEWLDGCYEWIEGEFHLNPATQLDEIIQHVESQLLQSNLSDSMVAGTGLPTNIPPIDKTMITGPAVLVEIISITDVGQSAFTLQNVRQARIDRADLAGLAGDGDDDEGPIPKYPRSMLRFQLSDGSTVLQAFEYRRLPELELGETPLGYKMLIKDVRVRRGLAYLEPKCVVMKGGQNEERNAMQDHDFARSLRLRLGQPDIEDEDQPEPPPAAPSAAPAQVNRAPPVAPPAAPAQVNPVAPQAPTPARVPGIAAAGIRSPFRELSEPPSPIAGPSRPSYDDDEGQPRRRKVPSRAGRSPSPAPPPRNRHETQSHYFTSASGSGAGSSSSKGRNAEILARERLFSPHRQPPVVVPDSDDEEPAPSATAVAGLGPSHQPPSPRTASSDDLFDEMYADPALFEQLDRVEREAMATQTTSTTAARTATARAIGAASTGPSSISASGSGSGPSGSSSAVESGLSGVGTGSNSSGSNRGGGADAGETERTAVDRVNLDIVTIDSDEDDKENVPVPTRHVRRRTARMAVTRGDVIELSD